MKIVYIFALSKYFYQPLKKIKIMLQQEFHDRVKMSVSAEEFEAIHAVYMYSYLDKDEFCKLWVKMNRTRVDNAKKELKERQQRRWRINRLLKIEAKLDKAESHEVAEDVLTASDINVLESVGISIKEWFNPLPINGISEGFWRHRNSTSLWCDVHDYLKKELTA